MQMSQRFLKENEKIQCLFPFVHKFKSQTLNAFYIPPSVFKYTDIYYNMIQSTFRNSKSQGVLAFIGRLEKNTNKPFFCSSK